MLLHQIVSASASIAATRSRTAKVTLLAAVLDQAAPGELEIVTTLLAGRLRQRRTGLGWRGLKDLPAPSPEPGLTVADVDAIFARMESLHGPGSQAQRLDETQQLFARATAEEQRWLADVIGGGLRQGALESLVTEALARASGVSLPAVRRAAMLAGGTPAIAETAFAGGADALAEVGLEVGRPVLPMLASSAPDVASALAALTKGSAAESPVIVDAKLDGIRVQVHKRGDEVRIASRSLDDLTDRLPQVVAVAAALPCVEAVLDGEALLVTPDGRPHPFQETAARSASLDQSADATDPGLTPFFFDLLHLDGSDLLDAPAHERLAALDLLVPPAHRVRRLVTDSREEAEAFAADVGAAGHEGVVCKSPTAPYAAGRRGAAWVKVKPVHTLDLVVLAVERGSGRRAGWLSNIHLGARDPERPGEFVMLGKTFKGMTDEMLAWQTERFTELALSPAELEHPFVVRVRPEQVVEIALDGLQTSSRYPGGVALRFARVVRYRDDKVAAEADSLSDVLRLRRTPPQP